MRERIQRGREGEKFSEEESLRIHGWLGSIETRGQLRPQLAHPSRFVEGWILTQKEPHTGLREQEKSLNDSAAPRVKWEAGRGWAGGGAPVIRDVHLLYALIATASDAARMPRPEENAILEKEEEESLEWRRKVAVRHWPQC